MAQRPVLGTHALTVQVQTRYGLLHNTPRTVSADKQRCRHASRRHVCGRPPQRRRELTKWGKQEVAIFRQGRLWMFKISILSLNSTKWGILEENFFDTKKIIFRQAKTNRGKLSPPHATTPLVCLVTRTSSQLNCTLPIVCSERSCRSSSRPARDPPAVTKICVVFWTCS